MIREAALQAVVRQAQGVELLQSSNFIRDFGDEVGSQVDVVQPG